ncbi:MAG TPA: PAS domain S-box protein [Solirubrobacteraceae bacterium]
MSGRRTPGAEDAPLFLRVDRDGVFVTWSAGLEDVFGYTAAEVLGRNLEFLVPPALRPLHRRGFNRALETGRLKRQGKVVHSLGVHKDGRKVPFRAMDILEHDEDGAVATVAAVIVEHGWGSITHRLRVVEPAGAGAARG